MSIFSRVVDFARKLNPSWMAMASYSDVPQAIRMNRNFKTYVKEGYKNSDTLYKCISYIIRNGAAIPPVLYADETKQKKIESHPLLDKLKRPNPEQSGVAYREAVLGYKLLAGNSFQYAIRAKNGGLDELWVLRPDRVEILIQPKRGIVGYRYQDLDGIIDPSNIGHTKYWNPDDDNEMGMGMSPVEAAALNIDMQIAGKKWNLALLQNGARPPGIWKIPMLMGKNEREKLEQKLNEKFAGAKAAGKSPLFDGGLDWQSTGLAPAQMDYLDSLKYNGGSIANILNIAPQLVGDTSSSTYDNMKQAKIWSYTEAIFPELDDLYALWNVWLVPMYPDLARSGAYLYYDKESVEVIQELIQAQKDAQAERANKLWLDGMLMQNEARVLAGFPESPEGKVYRIGNILVPADRMMEYAEQSLTMPAAPPAAQPEPLSESLQNGGESNETEETASVRSSMAVAEGNGKVGGVGYQVKAKALDLSTIEQKQAYAARVEQNRERWYEEAEKRLRRYFEEERKAVVAAIENAALPETAEVRVEAALERQLDNLKSVLIQLYQDVALDSGKQVRSDLQAGSEQKGLIQDFLDFFGAHVLEYLLLLAGDKVTQISTTTQAMLRLALTEGVAAGESILKLAKRIDDLYLKQIIPNRSTVIARTEVVSANNWGAIEAAKQSGLILHKVWLATEDARTRPAHAAADGQEVALDEPFEVGGEKLMQPGDRAGSAENVIQCRCTVYFKRVKAAEQTEQEKAVPVRVAYRQFMEATLR